MISTMKVMGCGGLLVALLMAACSSGTGRTGPDAGAVHGPHESVGNCDAAWLHGRPPESCEFACAMQPALPPPGLATCADTNRPCVDQPACTGARDPGHGFSTDCDATFKFGDVVGCCALVVVAPQDPSSVEPIFFECPTKSTRDAVVSRGGASAYGRCGHRDSP